MNDVYVIFIYYDEKKMEFAPPGRRGFWGSRRPERETATGAARRGQAVRGCLVQIQQNCDGDDCASRVKGLKPLFSG